MNIPRQVNAGMTKRATIAARKLEPCQNATVEASMRPRRRVGMNSERYVKTSGTSAPKPIPWRILQHEERVVTPREGDGAA